MPQLEELCAVAKVPPVFVQNRCYARMGWDFAVRHFCEEHGIVYQGFSLLTANPHVVGGAPVAGVAKKHGKTPEQVVFRYALEMKMLPLTGTTQEAHMRQDLDAVNFELDEADHAALEDTAFA